MNASFHPVTGQPAAAADFEAVTGEWDQSLKHCDETQLLAMLRTIQMRLGTRAELADDLSRVRTVAHRLNNLRTASQLGSSGCRFVEEQ